MSIREKVLQYFNMDDEDKGMVLIEIIDKYNEILLDKSGITLIEIIDYDIQHFLELEEFELVQALTDIKRIILEIK